MILDISPSQEATEIPEIASAISMMQAASYDPSGNPISSDSFERYIVDLPMLNGIDCLNVVEDRILNSQKNVVILDLGSRDGKAMEDLSNLLEGKGIYPDDYDVICFQGGDRSHIEKYLGWKKRANSNGFIFLVGDMLTHLYDDVQKVTAGEGVDILLGRFTVYHSPFDILVLQMINDSLLDPEYSKNIEGGVAMLARGLRADRNGRLIITPGENPKQIPITVFLEMLIKYCGWNLHYEDHGYIDLSWRKTAGQLPIPLKLSQIQSEHFAGREAYEAAGIPPGVRATFTIDTWLYEKMLEDGITWKEDDWFVEAGRFERPDIEEVLWESD
jgi:hypothetical protein